jgi:replication-associated recombination protein RarA
MGAYGAVLEPEAEEFLADIAGGDARHALNAIELGVMTTDRSDDGKIHITREVAQECIQKRVARYDKDGDNHYDTISAFIKSMRGSDPDAAVYYLARMLNAGGDPKFIARRMVICASEDVGNISHAYGNTIDSVLRASMEALNKALREGKTLDKNALFEGVLKDKAFAGKTEIPNWSPYQIKKFLD